ncbi:MAG: glycoside hydrolase family 9 protein [Balneolaceae bacterium]
MNLPHSLVAVFLILMVPVGCQQSVPAPFIAIDQVGYRQFGPKQAFQVHGQSTQFELIRSDTTDTVKSIPAISTLGPDLATGDRVTIIDFSAVNRPGEYQIRSTDTNEILSDRFVIAKDPYQDVLPLLVKSYYYHRCGSRVADDSQWGYELCHLDDAELYDQRGAFLDVTGGWHDAGDYNKFSVNTSLSAALLLYAYEHNSQLASDLLPNIPESGNGIPNILDEVSYALQWLLKMQAANGAVYHKVSQETWIGEFMPDQDPAKRYLFEFSSTATASFSATAALGARLLSDFEPELSAELEAASRRAWEYLSVHPENVPMGGFKNPPGVTGGEYGDMSDRDERIWAAAELFRLTGEISFLHYFTENYPEITGTSIPPLSWRNVHSLAIQAFLSWPAGTVSQSIDTDIRMHLMDRAEALLRTQNANNYRTLLRSDEYYWGSNSVGLAYAFDLLQAYRVTGTLAYLNSVLDQLHYLFGRNPFNRSQVTGAGSRSVEHPYHQLSETGAFSAPVPGMLVGGPNAVIHLDDRPISGFPGKNYEDQFKNYLVNEPAINFTAILVSVVAMVSSPEVHLNQNHASEGLHYR